MFVNETLIIIQVIQEILMLTVDSFWSRALLRCLTLSYIHCHMPRPLLGAVNQTNN